MCDFVFKDNNLLKFSNQFFLYIIDMFLFTPECLDPDDADNIYNPFIISVINNQYYPLLNKLNQKSKFLKENLKYIFKYQIFQYYEEDLFNRKLNTDHNSNHLEIEIYLGKSSYKYFLRAYEVLYEILNSNKEIPLKNIKELFCISFCNFFLEKFTFYLVSQRQLVCDYYYYSIIEFFNSKNDNIIKTFKLFILNELKTKYIVDKKEFLNINKWTEEYYLEELFKEIDLKIIENNNTLKNMEYQYPFYNELLSIPIVKENDIKEIFKIDENAQKKYPILYSYLNTNKEKLQYLKSFKEINDFINYMIQKYSYKILRDQAKYIKLKDELSKKNIPADLFELYKITDKYKKYELYPKKLDEEDILSFFLIDDGELGYGMYLASIYEKYILIQNNFLYDVIDNINKSNNNKNKKLEYLKEKIHEEINIHKANEYNILSFTNTNENFHSFNEIIFFYSYKDSFNNNFDFEHSKNKINFNLEEIEEQLEYLLLKKKKFKNNIDFVIYQYEGFRSDNSSILSSFFDKYSPKTLNTLEHNYLVGCTHGNSTEFFIKVFFYLQSLIKLYSDLPSLDKDIKIEYSINDFKPLYDIYDMKYLFLERFTISQIISIYEYLELLWFNEIKENMFVDYKKVINEEKKKNIEKFFQDNKSVVINKLVISTTIRKFISRYLVGKRQD